MARAPKTTPSVQSSVPTLSESLNALFSPVMQAALRLNYPVEHSVTSALNAFLLSSHRITFGPLHSKKRGCSIPTAQDRLQKAQQDWLNWEKNAGALPDFESNARTVLYRNKRDLAACRFDALSTLCAELKKAYWSMTGTEWVFTGGNGYPQEPHDHHDHHEFEQAA